MAYIPRWYLFLAWDLWVYCWFFPRTINVGLPGSGLGGQTYAKYGHIYYNRHKWRYFHLDLTHSTPSLTLCKPQHYGHYSISSTSGIVTNFRSGAKSTDSADSSNNQCAAVQLPLRSTVLDLIGDGTSGWDRAAARKKENGWANRTVKGEYRSIESLANERFGIVRTVRSNQGSPNSSWWVRNRSMLGLPRGLLGNRNAE